MLTIALIILAFAFIAFAIEELELFLKTTVAFGSFIGIIYLAIFIMETLI